MLTEEAEDWGSSLEDLRMGTLTEECFCDLFPDDVVPQQLLIEIRGGAYFLPVWPDDVREWPLELNPCVDGLLALPLENCSSMGSLE